MSSQLMNLTAINFRKGTEEADNQTIKTAIKSLKN